MLSLLSLALFALASVVAAKAVPANQDLPAPGEWPYTIGWNGVVSDPLSFGTPLNITGLIPNEEHPSALEGRQNPGTPSWEPLGIYICEHKDWGQPCGYARQPIWACIVLGSDWKNKISAIGPDKGNPPNDRVSHDGILLYVYDSPDCTGTTMAIVHPGLGDLSFDYQGGGRNWNDRISSFAIYRCNGYACTSPTGIPRR